MSLDIYLETHTGHFITYIYDKLIEKNKTIQGIKIYGI